jgi:hypothetical protein
MLQALINLFKGKSSEPKVQPKAPSKIVEPILEPVSKPDIVSSVEVNENVVVKVEPSPVNPQITDVVTQVTPPQEKPKKGRKPRQSKKK